MINYKNIGVCLFFIISVTVSSNAQGNPVKIVMHCYPTIVAPDGISTSTITANVCDQNNNIITNSTSTITFNLFNAGNGKLEGPNPVRVTNGSAKIIFKTGISATVATITATAEGLTQGTVDVIVSNPPDSPKNLLCDGMVGPSGITNFTPVLSWEFSDIDLNDTQSAFNLIVADNINLINGNIGNIWNTGKFVSRVSSIQYCGTILQPGTTYYWKVRTWDNQGLAGSFSAVETFSTSQTIPPKDYALQFTISPTTSYVKIPISGSLSITDMITVEAFVKVNSLPAIGQISNIVGFSGSTDNGYGILIGDDGSIIVILGLTTSPMFNFHVPVPNGWQPGKWYHIAFCFDGGLLFVFRDGLMLGQTQIQGQILAPVPGSSLFFGGYLNEHNPSAWFDGAIDEVRISRIPRYTNDFEPPKTMFKTDQFTAGLWHLNETGKKSASIKISDLDNGTPVNDDSGNNNNGTAYGVNAIGGYFDSLNPIPSITVTSPNGGEIWAIGTQASVTWVTNFVVGNLDIDLTTDNGTTWTTIMSNIPNNWVSVINVPDTPSTNCKIRIKEIDGAPADISDNSFSIESPGITVISPNGSETWVVGTQQAVNWTTTGIVGNVNIKLSTDGGASWIILVSSITNTGSKLIVVPNTPSTECKIKVEEIDNEPSDISDTNFTILSSGTANNAPNAPSGLKCNNQTNPGGLTDYTPDLSWNFSDPDVGDTQSAYRILVADSLLAINNSNGNIWDTGKITSTATVVTYSGKTLQKGATYYWKVQTWDNNDTSGPYSDYSVFSMESLKPPAIAVDKNIIDFGEVGIAETKTISLLITNTGEGTLLGTISSDRDWILLSATNFSGNNFGVDVTVDNTVLNKTEGQYTGTINITSNGGSVTVEVKVTAVCVLVRPNPYNPEKGLLTFFGNGIVPCQTIIKIYTLSGELLKELSAKTGDIIWDGKTEKNEPVTNGIYLYTYESPKEKGIGKFTVLRNK